MIWRRRRKTPTVIPEAAQAMDQFKFEVANELGTNSEYETGYWGNVAARECGNQGGEMVRRMIAAAEESLVENANNPDLPES